MEQDSRYYYGLALESLDNNKYEKALEYFVKSNNIESHFKTYERMCYCYKKLNKMVEARECIENAYKMNGNNDKVAVEYAEFLIQEGRIELAKNLLINILQRNNSYGPANKLLADIK